MLMVHKYPIPLGSSFTLDLPVEHTILKVDLQQNEPMMWILVETQDTAVNTYGFVVVGTGQPLLIKSAVYVGTFLMRNDSLVFHVFQIPTRIK